MHMRISPSSLARVLARLSVFMAIATAGCLPMIPIPGAHGDDPYPEVMLDSLQPGVTTRDEVLARLGAAPIARRDGELLIYGAGMETGGRLLVIAPPFIPVTIPSEQFRFLFLEFDATGLLRSRQMVISPDLNAGEGTCDSQGHCLHDVAWTTEGAFPVWSKSGGVKEGERAVVTASIQEEDDARRLQTPQAGCTLYFFSRSLEPKWYQGFAAMSTGTVYYALDDQPRFKDTHDALFAMWHLAEGRHRISATTKKGDLRAEFPVDCAGPGLMLVLGEIAPTVSGLKPKVSFATITSEQAGEEMASRRLLLQ